jgi:hypothetical protein
LRPTRETLTGVVAAKGNSLIEISFGGLQPPFAAATVAGGFS